MIHFLPEAWQSAPWLTFLRLLTDFSFFGVLFTIAILVNSAVKLHVYGNQLFTVKTAFFLSIPTLLLTLVIIRLSFTVTAGNYAVLAARLSPLSLFAMSGIVTAGVSWAHGAWSGRHEINQLKLLDIPTGILAVLLLVFD